MSDTSPSGNGSNGAFQNHDRLGRFVKNNAGGPGNPFGRQVAALRSALLASVTAQDVTEVLAAVLVQAKKGNVSAARLFLAYTVGKPADTVNPDETESDEWQLTQKNVARPEEIKHSFGDMPVQLANTVARATRPAISDGLADRLATMLKAPVAEPASSRPAGVAEPADGPAAARTPLEPALPAAVAPSTNGSNGRPAPAGPHEPAEPRARGAAHASGARGAMQPINRNPLQTVMTRRW